MIDIRSIAGNTDSWYDLKPRSTKSEVSGSIRKVFILISSYKRYDLAVEF